LSRVDKGTIPGLSTKVKQRLGKGQLQETRQQTYLRRRVERGSGEVVGRKRPICKQIGFGGSAEKDRVADPYANLQQPELLKGALLWGDEKKIQ